MKVPVCTKVEDKFLANASQQISKKKQMITFTSHSVTWSVLQIQHQEVKTSEDLSSAGLFLFNLH